MFIKKVYKHLKPDYSIELVTVYLQRGYELSILGTCHKALCLLILYKMRSYVYSVLSYGKYYRAGGNFS